MAVVSKLEADEWIPTDNRNRHCCTCTAWLPLHTLPSNDQTQNVRAFSLLPLAGCNDLRRHDVLALPQLLDLLELPVGDRCDLGHIMASSHILLELYKPMAHVLPRWRRMRSHHSSGERCEDHCPNTNAMETWPVCVHPDAGNLNL